MRLFLEGLAYLISQQRYIIDHAARQNLLAYAGGDFLDHLGILTDTQRLPAQAARTTMQFSLAEALGSAVTIPQGTRVTPGEQIYFATIETVEIAPGDTSATVTAECQSPGAFANGFVAGQINKMVDLVGHVSSVQNLTTSLGGSDLENDDNFRERIQLSAEKYTNAGSRLSYKYWALDAHQDILDVSVISPEPGHVAVYVLMENGELPSPEILTLVEDSVSGDKTRPLTDFVSVSAPVQVNYDLDVTYYISSANSVQAASIQKNVQDAIDSFLLWQRSAIGRDINPSELISRIQQAGAKRADVASPGFTALGLAQVAKDVSASVTYGGLEDA